MNGRGSYHILMWHGMGEGFGHSALSRTDLGQSARDPSLPGSPKKGSHQSALLACLPQIPPNNRRNLGTDLPCRHRELGRQEDSFQGRHLHAQRRCLCRHHPGDAVYVTPLQAQSRSLRVHS